MQTISLVLLIYLSLHVSWLPWFLVQHMGASLWAAALVYVCALAWFGALTISYWWAVERVLTRRWRLLGIACALPLYFYVLAHHSLPFCKGLRGYPLANPLLPVVPLVVPRRVLQPGRWAQVMLGGEECWICPFLPDVDWYRLSRGQHTQRIYQRLSELPDPPGEAVGRALIVSPESFFAYNVTVREKHLWAGALPCGVRWWFGAMAAAKGGGSHQVIEEIDNNLEKIGPIPISQPYVKHLCIDLFEECDEKRQFHRIFKKFFGKSIGGVVAAWDGAAEENFLVIPGRSSGFARERKIRNPGNKKVASDSSGPLFAPNHVRVLICAEQFWPPTNKQGASLIFVNEHWFPSWLAWTMPAGGAWRALIDQESVLWVGHKECIWVREAKLPTI
jgi:hypothetical protein